MLFRDNMMLSSPLSISVASIMALGQLQSIASLVSFRGELEEENTIYSHPLLSLCLCYFPYIICVCVCCMECL